MGCFFVRQVGVNVNLDIIGSNGERTQGWEEVRRHIETDFRQDVDLAMKLHEVLETSLGPDAAVLTYRYDITVTAGTDTVTCSRHASMTVHRGAEGWQVAALHVSTLPPAEASTG